MRTRQYTRKFFTYIQFTDKTRDQALRNMILRTQLIFQVGHLNTISMSTRYW